MKELPLEKSYCSFKVGIYFESSLAPSKVPSLAQDQGHDIGLEYHEGIHPYPTLSHLIEHPTEHIHPLSSNNNSDDLVVVGPDCVLVPRLRC